MVAANVFDMNDKKTGDRQKALEEIVKEHEEAMEVPA